VYKATRFITALQLQQVIKTDVIWSGCGTFSYRNPMRILVKLGNFQAAALVDSGSDFDAIDADLSSHLEQTGNSSFVSRSQLASLNVTWHFKQA